MKKIERSHTYPIFITIIFVMMVFIVISGYFNNLQKGLLHKMHTYKTAQEVGARFNEIEEEKWKNHTYQYHYIFPVPDNFNVASYRNSHSDDYVVTYQMAGERFLEACSNSLPEKNIFSSGYNIGEDE